MSSSFPPLLSTLDLYTSPPPIPSKKGARSKQKKQINTNPQQSSTTEEVELQEIQPQSIMHSLTARPPEKDAKSLFSRSPRSVEKIMAKYESKFPSIGYFSPEEFLAADTSVKSKKMDHVEDASVVSNLATEYSVSVTSPRHKKLMKKHLPKFAVSSYYQVIF